MTKEKLSVIYDKISVSPDGCWNWTKSCCTAGYGQLMVNKVRWMAHRYVAHVVYGIEYDSPLLVRHDCHNPRCCNPHHLSIGTHKDNYHDSFYAHEQHILRNTYSWIIDGITYTGLKKAVVATGISENCIQKHTDRQTRVFDIDAYRQNCRIANRIPKI